jgi:phosphoglycolate phosphatase-like HAD superfamily hydrolase
VSGLALFDIDGTLTVSNEIDTDCFVRAFNDEFGLTNIPVGWQHYEHSTDRGIAAEVLRRAWKREATENELAQHRARFVSMLGRRGGEIVPVAGAAEFLDAVRDAGWTIAIITGAWSDSASLKLAAAGIAGFDVFSCDQMTARPEIVRCAMDRFAIRPTVLFGDGTWDAAAARELGIGFIGIGSGEGAQRLRAAGAEQVFPDYRDRKSMLHAMLRSAR